MLPKHFVLCAIPLAVTPVGPMNEWCPQWPVSPSQLLQTHAYGFFYGVNLSHISSYSLPAAFYFPSTIAVSKIACLIMMCPH